jgi:hypothetical protein
MPQSSVFPAYFGDFRVCFAATYPARLAASFATWTRCCWLRTHAGTNGSRGCVRLAVIVPYRVVGSSGGSTGPP